MARLKEYDVHSQGASIIIYNVIQNAKIFGRSFKPPAMYKRNVSHRKTPKYRFDVICSLEIICRDTLFLNV